MALSIRLTSGMTPEEMAPLWPDIIKCLEKYCARFPDETPENIIQQCAAGNRQLWIVQDEEGRVVLTPVTEITQNTVTGRNKLLLAEVGGSRLKEAMVLLKDIEDWAVREHDAKEADLIGRSRAWGRHLDPHGYSEAAIIYRKSLEH